MAKQKNEIKEKTVAALKQSVAEARRQLFDLQLDNKMRKLKNTSSLNLKRKEIARMLTAISSAEKQNKKEVSNG